MTTFDDLVEQLLCDVALSGSKGMSLRWEQYRLFIVTARNSNDHEMD